MKKITLISCISLFAVSNAWADKSANVSDKIKQSSGLVAKAHLVSEMAVIAHDNKDALMMLAAAKLDAQIPKSDVEIEKKSTSTGESQKEKPFKGTLFEQAESLAKGDEVMLALIVKTKQNSMGTVKGLQGGPQRTIERVSAKATDTYKLAYKGKALAEVAISGDGDTDLDLYVFDENENLICSSTEIGDDEYCSWTPKWSGTFYIQVQNLGRLYNEYIILSN